MRAAPILRAGRLAQLVERFVYTEDVGSSSLSSPTIFPDVFCDIMIEFSDVSDFLLVLLCWFYEVVLAGRFA